MSAAVSDWARVQQSAAGLACIVLHRCKTVQTRDSAEGRMSAGAEFSAPDNECRPFGGELQSGLQNVRQSARAVLAACMFCFRPTPGRHLKIVDA